MSLAPRAARPNLRVDRGDHGGSVAVVKRGTAERVKLEYPQARLGLADVHDEGIVWWLNLADHLSGALPGLVMGRHCCASRSAVGCVLTASDNATGRDNESILNSNLYDGGDYDRELLIVVSGLSGRTKTRDPNFLGDPS